MKTNAKLKIATKNTNGGGLPFKIESGIEVPSRTKPNPYESVFAAMRVNQSFLIGDDEATIKSVRYQAGKWAKENKSSFGFRQTNDGLRCWKTK